MLNSQNGIVAFCCRSFFVELQYMHTTASLSITFIGVSISSIYSPKNSYHTCFFYLLSFTYICVLPYYSLINLQPPHFYFDFFVLEGNDNNSIFPDRLTGLYYLLCENDNTTTNNNNNNDNNKNNVSNSIIMNNKSLVIVMNK